MNYIRYYHFMPMSVLSLETSIYYMHIYQVVAVQIIHKYGTGTQLEREPLETI